ncbi:oligopeptide transporter, OPT family protein [Bryobacterales bacterium F-183]|nr:oligopeptide transporter, OPT family protein [Bryobacterales bacterium F-183]
MNLPKPRQPELTIKSVTLGLFLALVFGAANAYLGMRAGQTVAATIPAAVIAMALFRLPRFKGGILEQNITRTAASVGEALVAGAIFTIPSFLLVDLDGKRLWTDLRDHYWEASLVLLVGGLLGVFFIILLRKPLCVDSDLPFPESVASVEIVRASEGSSDAPRLIFGSMAFGGLIQVLKSSRAVMIFKEYVEGFWAFPQSMISGLGTAPRGGGIPWTSPALSPALIGVGYIIGPELACINFSGGLIAWWVLIPTLQLFDPDLASRIGGDPAPGAIAGLLWRNVVRPIAIGTMLVSAANTMWRMRSSLAASLKGAFAVRSESAAGDIPTRWVFLSIFALLIPTVFIYANFTGTYGLAIQAAAIMVVIGFVLSAIGGYLVGLVGSSNQPLSGLTLSALLISALLLVAFGVRGAAGVAAVLGVAAVVCVAGSVSGSLIQDLKAGHLLGGTPWKMQVVEIIAVVLLAFFLMGPIIALHEAEIANGGIGGRTLPAPQAALMAQLAKGIVGGQMAWGLLLAGMAFGIALLLCGARAPMLIAVGMYLPFETSAAIFVGGVFKWLADRVSSASAEAEQRGTLVASGLIAGEAIVGIVLAVAALQLPERTPFHWFDDWGGWLSLIGFASLGYLLVRIPAAAKTAK